MIVDERTMLKVIDVNKTWVISDTHWGHSKIISYANRPFPGVEAMDSFMIDRWNENVKSNLHTVYHLGDFCFGRLSAAKKYFQKLNGKICILTMTWHHDSSWMYGLSEFDEIYSATGDPVTFLQPSVVLIMPSGFHQVNGYRRSMHLSHYPHYVWHHKHYLSWHVYGHCHDVRQSIPGSPLAMNVNVEAAHMNYGPISITDIGNRLSRIEANLGLKPVGAK